MNTHVYTVTKARIQNLEDEQRIIRAMRRFIKHAYRRRQMTRDHIETALPELQKREAFNAKALQTLYSVLGFCRNRRVAFPRINDGFWDTLHALTPGVDQYANQWPVQYWAWWCKNQNARPECQAWQRAFRCEERLLRAGKSA